MLVMLGLLIMSESIKTDIVDGISVDSIDELSTETFVKEVKFASPHSNMRLKTP